MWDRINRLATLVEALVLRGMFEDQDNTSSEFAGKMKGDSRALLDDLVPHCVRRFIWNTAPHKFSVANFEEWGGGAAVKFRDFRKVHVMRKYDGWFVVLYVNADKEVCWQTMSGFLNSRIYGLMREFVGWVKEMVAADVLTPYHAFKIEFVIQDANGVDHLQLVGKKVDPRLYFHKIVITDFLSPYSRSLDGSLMSVLESQRSRARDKNKQAPLNPADWRRIWNSRGDIARRMDIITKIVDEKMPDALKAQVICAHVKSYYNTDPLALIALLANALCHNNVHHEGFILHCSDARESIYSIFKFKLEYLGGLGLYYSPWVDQIQAVEKHAGRQFVVRLLTVECHPFSYIPYRLGVGYWDETKGRWVVTDSLPLKYTTDIIEGFQSMTGDRVSTKAIANAIAKILLIAKPDTDTKELVFTDHFKKESSLNILNVCNTGLIIAGSANAVYMSEQNNYHLQAAVIKHVGLGQTEFKRELAISDVMEEFAKKSAAFSVNVVGTSLFTAVEPILPQSVSIEWDNNKWKEMEDHIKFNVSCCLSECRDIGVDLYSRLCEVNVSPFHDHIDRSPIDFPSDARFNTFMFLGCPALNAFRVIVEVAKGYCFQSVEEVDGANIGTTLDILIVRNTLTRDKYLELKAKFKNDFVVLNDPWYESCRKKHGFVQIEQPFVYDMSVWCEHYDKLDYVNRLISRRSRERADANFIARQTIHDYRSDQLPLLPPSAGPASDQPPSPPVQPETLPWKRRNVIPDTPSTRKINAAADHSRPLSGRSYFIFKYIDEDVDECHLKSLVYSRHDIYNRHIKNLTLKINNMGGEVVAASSPKSLPPVVIHLPNWDVPAYEKLLHAKYFSDCEEAIENSTTQPQVEKYIFSRTGAGMYIDSMGTVAASNWFQL